MFKEVPRHLRVDEAITGRIVGEEASNAKAERERRYQQQHVCDPLPLPLLHRFPSFLILVLCPWYFAVGFNLISRRGGETAKYQVQSTKLVWVLGPCFYSRFSFELAPADNGAAYRVRDRFDHDVVHHLAIAEPLQENPPEQAPALILFQNESKTCCQPINGKKQRVIEKYLVQVGHRIPGGLLQPIQARGKECVDQHQIHHRRYQGEDDLKDPDVGHCDEPERAIMRTE